jgi:hypothetical protein
MDSQAHASLEKAVDVAAKTAIFVEVDLELTS